MNDDVLKMIDEVAALIEEQIGKRSDRELASNHFQAMTIFHRYRNTYAVAAYAMLGEAAMCWREIVRRHGPLE